MSFYTYHEFRLAQRAMSASLRETMSSLSSRANIGPYHASYEYSYSDFKGDARKLLREHFDGLYYTASWGDRCVMFKLPAALFDVSRVRPFEVAAEFERDKLSGLTATRRGSSVILTLGFRSNTRRDWLEPQGQFEEMMPLREELMEGDDRALYIAWLAQAEAGKVSAESTPPIPPGMGELTTAHRTLAAALNIKQDVLEAVAACAPQPELPELGATLEEIISELPVRKCRALLRRVVCEDPSLVRAGLRAMAFDRIRAQGAPDQVEALSRHDLEQERQRARERLDDQRERERLARIEERAEWKWTHAIERILASTPRYKEPIRSLKELRDLAEARGTLDEFYERLEPIIEARRTSATFMSRMKDAGLLLGGDDT